MPLELRHVTVRRAVAELRRRTLATGELRNPVTVRASDDRRIAALTIGLTGSGTDARSEHTLELLRNRLVPGTLGGVPGVEAHVGGLTAESKDFNDPLKGGRRASPRSCAGSPSCSCSRPSGESLPRHLRPRCRERL